MEPSLKMSELFRRIAGIVIVMTLSVPCAGLSATLLPDTSVITGAQIVETVNRIYYVNQGSTAASDNNAGTDVAAPLKTISAALTKALVDVRAGIATKVRIFPGTYRESAPHMGVGTEAGLTTLLVIEGTEPDKVIISGADVFTGWTSYNGAIYQHDWPIDSKNGFYDWPASLIAHRAEMVIVNGQMQRQRILEDYSKTGNVYDTYTRFIKPEDTLTAGTFGVAERDENGNKIYLYPPVGTNMATAVIEVCVRSKFMTISQKENLVLRNLTFRHFGNRKSFPWSDEYIITIEYGATNVLVENCVGEWNNNSGAPGIIWGSGFTNATQRNCRYNYNGFSGGSIDGTNTIIEDCQTNFNCWRGYWGDHISWDVAGMKFQAPTINQILRRHEAIGNLTEGIWYDIHCKNIKIQDLTTVLNLGNGLFTEISNGPFLVTRSLAALNGTNEFMYYTVGPMTYENNILYGTLRNPKEASMKFFWYARPGNEHWEREPFHPSGLTLTGNVITGDATEDYLMGFYGNPIETPQFHTVYEGNNNRWYHYSGSSTRRFLCGSNWQPDTVNFQGWCTFWGAKEQNPAWGDPQFVDPANLDFRLKSDSPLQARAASLPCKAISAAKLAEVKRFFAWAGYDYPVPSGSTAVESGIYGRASYPPAEAEAMNSRHLSPEFFDLRGRQVHAPQSGMPGLRGVVLVREHGRSWKSIVKVR